MKKIVLTVAALLLAITTFAQSPEKMSYQAVVRNASNSLLVSSPIGMQISILQNSTTGTAVYVETQTSTTNINGLVSVEIGSGTLVAGNFSSIDWSNGPYFVKTETDPTGGTNYTITGISQLLSVPYALHAKTADNGFSGNYADLSNAPTIPNAVSQLSNDAGYITSANDADSDPANEIQNLSLNGNDLSISGGNTIDLSKYKNLKKMSIDIMGSFLDGGPAFIASAIGSPGGLRMSKAVSPGPSFANSFVVPADYIPGDSIFIRMVFSSPQAGNAYVGPNFLNVVSSTNGFIGGPGSSQGLVGLPGSLLIIPTANTPVNYIGYITPSHLATPISPGDVITFGWFRYGAHATDTNPTYITLHGIELSY